MLDRLSHAARARADMPAVEVTSVVGPADADGALLGAAIMRPRTGEEREAFALEVAGWVIAREQQATSVQLLTGGVPLRELPIGFARPAVARALPGVDESIPCGFHGVLGALALRPEFALELVAVLDDGSRIRIGSISGRRARPSISVAAALRPLLVTSLGRSGTTWLMRMLERHPEVVVEPGRTYERTPARYWGRMLERLSEPSDPDAPPAAGGASERVGPNPSYSPAAAADAELGRWLGRTYVDRLADFCVKSIDDWYLLLARRQGKSGAVYFAEKNFLWPMPERVPVGDLYPDLREIFLVRDPRDVACSWLAFHGAKLGEEQILGATLPRLTSQLLAAWRDRGSHAELVRYEDLVLHPRRTLGRLLDNLGIDSAREVIGQLASGGGDEMLERHGTSGDLEATVGRWRTERDGAFRRRLNELFGEAIAEFGYDQGGDAPVA